MQIYVKLVDTYYMAANGLEGVIVKCDTITNHPEYSLRPGASVFVDIRNLRPFMRKEHHHLCDNWINDPVKYLFTIKGNHSTNATCEVVDNPFAHWNSLKSGKLH